MRKGRAASATDHADPMGIIRHQPCVVARRKRRESGTRRLHVGFVAPKLTMFSSIGLMVAILVWRPQGLYPVVKR